MQSYKLTLEYDGTHYHGFQIQKNGVTIQQKIEEALQKLFHQKIRIISCGRTDSGVHAENHVVNFKVDTKIQGENILKALNRYLPKDIVIKKVEKVKEGFHSQYDAKEKTYQYQIWQGKVRSPLKMRYRAYFPYEVNMAQLQKAIEKIKGEHDFRSFASKTPQDKNTIRTIFEAKVSKKGNQLTFTFRGNGFLYNMVRNLVGTLLWVGEGKVSVKEFEAIIKAKDRKKAGPIAPACGLTLQKVKY